MHKKLFNHLEHYLTPSLEDDQVKQERETEIEIYAKISKFEGLEAADSVEEQIQIQTTLGDKNFCRVRRTKTETDEKYVFTFKIKDILPNGTESRIEHNFDVNETFALDFLKTAKEVQVKTRYIFDAEKIVLSYHEHDEDKVIEVPGIKYEVDVYEMENGELCEWCKIDIEIDPIIDYIEHNYPDLKDMRLNIKISHLPFAPQNGFVKTSNLTPAQKSVVDWLYENAYNQDPVKFSERGNKWQRKSS